ncbi:DUF5112 domain-containing protein [Prevotella sp. A2879]|uniref:histidine kinase n=1 Tax=Prevotella vespertina TaxID=2608404 RepID=A0A7C9HHH9_9BACT|nr:DUF5112 domain-containing protein [Prevotella vespertina]MUL28786.1 DUF5112 domain-containing protein [Prevotella vespertina]
MKTNRTKEIIMSLAAICLLLFFSACNAPHRQQVDDYNDKAYAAHYRNLDSVKIYAKQALALSNGYNTGKAEALNNLAFIYLMQMHFDKAYATLNEVMGSTDDQVELLVADIQMMRLCQRESNNKEYYDYNEEANKRFLRINEDKRLLTDRQRRRMVYARSEYAIVSSTYYYYVGLEQPSVRALSAINPDGEIQTDMPQLLAYLYNVGAGGIFTKGKQEEINQKEFDYLIRCYMLAIHHNYPYWEANSLQALSEHLVNDKSREALIRDNLPSFKYLKVGNLPDSLIAGNLAERSLSIFQKYGDVYQTAGSYRTLASCYWQIKDYRSALICLQNALKQNPAINQAPDLVASIREQLSVVYSAIDNKQASDYNRNIYLDLQEQTRQDRYYEARADQLDSTSQQLNIMIIAIGLIIIVILSLLIIFHYLRRRADNQSELNKLLLPLEEWKHHNIAYMAQLDDEYTEVSEQLTISNIHLIDNKRRYIEQRAKVSLVNSIMPLINRMLHEINKLKRGGESDAVRSERYTYIRELTDMINNLNSTLTEWIQLRQGRLSLHIESFPVQQVFDIVKKGRMAFQLKGVQLKVEDTAAIVKADRILTLFMVNTLADNARKFTPAGGKVCIKAVEEADYVELSVEDTGCGINEETQQHLFDRKPIHDQKDSTSHGFGLMNCNGIINKYRKISQIFTVCQIGVKSEENKGSRFFFRLPKGVSRVLLFLLIAFSSLCTAQARPQRNNDKATAIARKDYMTLAGIYADSAYFSNINGQYEQTLRFADTCRYYINQQYHKLYPHGKLFMQRIGSLSNVAAEIKWFHADVPIDYRVILDIRNESAVAALALHEWDLYKYNNNVYTHLFKERSADSSLGEYCRMMMKSETNKNVAIALLVLLLLSILPVYYVMYYRHRLTFQFSIEQIKHINAVLLSDVSVEKKLKEVNRVNSDRLPERLRNIVQQIREALVASQEASQKSKADIEALEDEVHCVEYENERLHISNSILDNCLSTLKHETMYYPSRIRQLVETDTDSQLEAIDELAVYYKELYSLLSQQAMHQVRAIKLMAKSVDIATLVPENKFKQPLAPIPPVAGDPVMIAYLFDILYSENQNQPLRITAEEHQKQYVILHVLLSSMHLSAEECRELFSPQAQGMMFFSCRQIVRDNGEATNRRGCGIIAKPTEEGTEIQITLAKA